MSADFRRIADAEGSVSGKIRALDRAGVPRAEIARFLNKRYQHVRNVLEADRAKAIGHAAPYPIPSAETRREGPPAILRPGSGGAAIFRVTAGRDGTLVLPGRLLAAAGCEAGDIVIAAARPGEITLRTAAASIERAQDLVSALIPGRDSLADSLLADRRREVREESDG